MLMDNMSSHSARNYDSEISKTIPYYSSLHSESINLIESINTNPEYWLDTGCGTGTFAELILDKFPKVQLVLADPSIEMLAITENKLNNQEIKFINEDTNSVIVENISFDIITAIQAHHYLKINERKNAVKNCFNLLKKDGIFITFENTRPGTHESTKITMEYWKNFQMKNGKNREEVEKHIKRFDEGYFPISINEHIKLYTETGFRITDTFWKSYMQVGFYCIK